MSNLMISEVGSVAFAQSRKARYLRITVKADKSITVTIPRRGSLAAGKEFLQSRIGWVRKQLRKIEEYERNEEVNRLGKPSLTDIDLEKAQGELFSRLEYLAERYGFSYRRAAFRCQKSKWGSCSGKNNITLNVNIAFLPAELQDYILLHELVHTKVKNHKREFWRELDSYTDGKAKKLSKELKKYRIKAMSHV